MLVYYVPSPNHHKRGIMKATCSFFPLILTQSMGWVSGKIEDPDTGFTTRTYTFADAITSLLTIRLRATTTQELLAPRLDLERIKEQHLGAAMPGNWHMLIDAVTKGVSAEPRGTRFDLCEMTPGITPPHGRLNGQDVRSLEHLFRILIVPVQKSQCPVPLARQILQQAKSFGVPVTRLESQTLWTQTQNLVEKGAVVSHGHIFHNDGAEQMN